MYVCRAAETANLSMQNAQVAELNSVDEALPPPGHRKNDCHGATGYTGET